MEPFIYIFGRRLTAKNFFVVLIDFSTEMGGTNVFLPKYVEPEMWEYFQFSAHLKISFKKQEDSDAVEFRALVSFPFILCLYSSLWRLMFFLGGAYLLVLRDAYAGWVECQD